MNVFIDPRFEPIYQQHPLVLVDVGARGGLKSNWEPARPHLRVIGFEPDRREFDALVSKTPAGGPITFFNTALHHRRGVLKLYVAKDRGLTSIFEPDRGFLNAFPEADRFDTVETAEIQVDTLDNVLREGGVHGVDFVKVDTQGSELFVLQGGQQALASSVVGIEVEVEFAPIYKDQPLFADVDAYLRGLGFALFDLRPVFWKRGAGRALGGPQGQMIWADALYFRTLPSLSALLAAQTGEARAAKLLKTLSSTILYGYYDYALEIVRQDEDSLPAEQRSAIEGLLRQQIGAGAMQNIPGRRQVAAAAHRLWKLSADRNDAWSISDAELGNPR